MAARLVQIRIEHIAAVDRPANRRSFLVIKQEKPADKEPDPVEKAAYVKPEDGKFCVYDSDGKKVGTYATMAEANEKKKMLAKGATMLTKEQIAKISDQDVQLAVVEQQEQIAAQEKKAKELEDEIAKLKGQPTSDQIADDELWKGAHPAARNRFEALLKERDDAKNLAKQESDRRLTDEWIVKSRSFKYLRITPEHFGKIMKTIAENAKVEADEIFRILEEADNTVAKGAIFSELGRPTKVTKTGERAPDATNVTDRVQALAADFRKLDPKLTDDQAVSKVFAENPEWYPLYKRENQIAV